jgi:hypothetical protein
MPADAQSPHCPRCGYDLAALPATWAGQCPTGGTCSECGLGFAWGDLLNPRLVDAAISFEHAEQRRGRAFLVTLRRLFRPRRFWTWVRMEWPVDAVRVVVFAALAGLLLYALGILLYTGAYALASIWSPWTPRGGLFGQAWINETALTIVDAVLPFCTQGIGWGLFRGYASAWLLEPLPIVALTAWLLTPLAFGALPETLRRCRVRRIHLLRVWLYGSAPIPLLLQLPRVLDFALQAFSIRFDPGFVGYLQLLVVLAWQRVWWGRAVRHYLRLPGAGAVAWAVVVMSFLAAVLIWMLAAGAWAYDGFLGPAGMY